MSESVDSSTSSPPTVTDTSPPATVTETPPPAPTPVTSHSDTSSQSERVDRLETAVSAVTESVATLTETIGRLVDATPLPDSTPVKQPWTHWGSRPKE